MQLHPLCEVFPRVSAEEEAAMIASLKATGFDPRRPIVTYEGKILDGANRWRICRTLRIEPTVVEYLGNDPLGYVVSQNIARRSLDASQRQMIAAKIATLKWGQTKEKDARGTDSSISVADAATLLRVGTTGIKAARAVLEHGTPELVQAVKDGRVTVEAAKSLMRLSAKEQGAVALEPDKRRRAKLIKQGKRAAAARPKPEKKGKPLVLKPQVAGPKGAGPYSIKDWEKLSPVERAGIIDAGLEGQGKNKFNAQQGDSIEWARWSHNTVTGCLHGCPYCYARDVAERQYAFGFAPMFHPDRLAAPRNTEFPASEVRSDASYGHVFANSMSDLFGAWVPKDWIEATLTMARAAPRWQFLTLTKFPQRAVEFEFPDNVWMGTTVDAQARVANAERAFEKIRCKTKWLSVEPMLERLKFTHLDLFQWVVIGGASASTKTPAWVPPFDWVLDLHHAAREAGCRIYHKTNLALGNEIRVREFPWVATRERMLPKSFHYLKGLE